MVKPKTSAHHPSSHLKKRKQKWAHSPYRFLEVWLTKP